MLTVNKSLILLLVLMYSMFPETKLIIDTCIPILAFRHNIEPLNRSDAFNKFKDNNVRS